MITNLEINKEHQQVIDISRWANMFRKGNVEFEFIGIENGKVCNPYIENCPFEIKRSFGIEGTRYLLDNYLTDILYFDVSSIETPYLSPIKVYLPKEIPYFIHIGDSYTSVKIQNLKVSGRILSCKELVLNKVENKGPRVFHAVAEKLIIKNSNMGNVYFIGNYCLVSDSNLQELEISSNDGYIYLKDSHIDTYKSDRFSILSAENMAIERVSFQKIAALFDSCKLHNIEGNFGNLQFRNCDFEKETLIQTQEGSAANYESEKYKLKKRGNNKILVYTKDLKERISTIKTSRVRNYI